MKWGYAIYNLGRILGLKDLTLSDKHMEACIWRFSLHSLKNGNIPRDIFENSFSSTYSMFFKVVSKIILSCPSYKIIFSSII